MCILRDRVPLQQWRQRQTAMASSTLFFPAKKPSGVKKTVHGSVFTMIISSRRTALVFGGVTALSRISTTTSSFVFRRGGVQLLSFKKMSFPSSASPAAADASSWSSSSLFVVVVDCRAVQYVPYVRAATIREGEPESGRAHIQDIFRKMRAFVIHDLLQPLLQPSPVPCELFRMRHSRSGTVQK